MEMTLKDKILTVLVHTENQIFDSIDSADDLIQTRQIFNAIEKTVKDFQTESSEK